MAFVVALGIAAALLGVSAFSTPAAAGNVSVTLFGSRTGWGTNSTNARSPGPNLTATLGDTVTLTVNSTDGRTHTWYLDYNNDSAWNVSAEPGTTFPNATTGNAVTITFVANHTGTFRYRSVGARDSAMVGSFAITAGGLFGGADNNTILVVAGVIVIIVAVIAFAAFFWRRMGKPGTPPPPTQ